MDFELRFSFFVSVLFYLNRKNFNTSVLSTMCQKADKAWAKLEDRWERDWALPTGTKWQILATTGKICSILSMAKEVIVLNER